MSGLHGYGPLRGVRSGGLTVLFQALEVVALGGNRDGQRVTRVGETVGESVGDDEDRRREDSREHRAQANRT